MKYFLLGVVGKLHNCTVNLAPTSVYSEHFTCHAQRYVGFITHEPDAFIFNHSSTQRHMYCTGLCARHTCVLRHESYSVKDMVKTETLSTVL